MPLTRATVIAAIALALAPRLARAQFVDRSVVVEADPAAPAEAAAPRVETLTSTKETEGRIDLRLTLSSFLYRERGGDVAPLVAGGAAPDDASPVRRFFGDLRGELTLDRLGGRDAGLRLDGRIRQTTDERYQAGAGAGGEYELRTALYHRGIGRAELRLGRQTVDAIGATRIDGVALGLRLRGRWAATVFGGAYPTRGSRSLDTDYPAIRNADGTTGAPLVPVAAGAGAAYTRPELHGDVGVVGVIATQAVRGADAADGRRGFVTTSGYWRPHPAFDLYHYGIVDVVAPDGPHLTSGSLGLDAFPTPPLSLSLAVHHVDSEVLAIAARNLLEDPDPAAMGQVENGTTIVRVSQDAARLAASLAVARARFQLSAAAGVHRRPPIAVTPTGGGMVEFPGATMGELTLTALDRRALGRLRVELSGSVLAPVGAASPSRSRGVVARLAVGARGERADLEVDVTAQRFADLGAGAGCATLDPVGCFGTATSRSAAVGGLASLSAAHDWLLLLDAHVGVRDAESNTLAQSIAWPRVLWVSAFARLQWRYR